MGFFVVRRGLAVRGGSVQIGADCNLYRISASVLRTNDGLTVDGALTPSGGVISAGYLAQTGSANMSGTPFRVPHGTIAPGLTQSGEIKMYDPTGAGKISMRIGGTVYTLAFPSATHGTVTITVGTPT